MFDLEKAIIAWRRSYEHRRAFFADDVEELERHVRDHVAWLVEHGHSDEEAFREAVRLVGDYASTEAEYRKVFWTKLKHKRALLRELIWELTMLQNYLKIAYRNLLRHKGYAFINVTGLAVGIACCLLILLFVRDELRYDRFHEHADRIARVLVREDQTVTPTIVAPLFEREFPEVEAATRVYPLGSYRPVVMRYEERAFEEEGFYFADSTVFNVFTLPFVRGNPQTALTRANTLVLTESTAQKYFGDQNPVGQFVEIEAGTEYEVTGVIEDLPSTSHVQFDVLASFASTSWSTREIWNSANFYTYLLLRDEAAMATLAPKVETLISRLRSQGENLSDDYFLTLQPLTDIHLYFEGRITYVYAFSAIALLILLVACANYVNLATARSARRAREVGIRKTAGAHRSQLVRQFFGESALLVVVALVLAVLLAEALLPVFNAVSGKYLDLRYLDDPVLLPALLGIGVLVSLVAGSYPALLLSSFRPVQVLKGTFTASTGNALFRKGLVVFQFAVTVFLIAATAIVYRQIDYTQTKDLGFDKERLVVLSISESDLRQQYRTIKEEVLQHPNVLHASAMYNIPGYQRSGYGLVAEGLNWPDGEALPIGGVPADEDIVETLGLELIAGTGFPKSDSYEPDSARYVYLVNEAALRMTGWSIDEALGRRITLSGPYRMGEIVGVVKDYHHVSLREQIYPLAFFIEPWQFSFLVVKIAPHDIPGTLAYLKETWQRIAPHRPFVYKFADQEFDALYRSDRQTGQIFAVFAGLAVLIACLGLLGLASFAAERRTKEIGVRKVLGATVTQIVLLLSKDFTRLVLVAFVVAVPVAYLVMQGWLRDFTYRVELSWWIFAGAGLAALVVAWLTVSFQSIKAALANPARSLRYE